MTDLRQQALKAVEKMPEKNLLALLPLLKILQEKETKPKNLFSLMKSLRNLWEIRYKFYRQRKNT